MYILKRDLVIAEAIKQIGKPCGKTNEYSAELDNVNFYNYPKNGVADSCSIFVDDMVYRCIDKKTADNAREALYEPDIDNCGAGCTQASGYFKDNNAWFDHMSNFHKGDKVFFKKSNGAIYHTGLIVDWDNKGIYTVEGNVGSKVVDRFYSYGDSKVAGAGRPKYIEEVIPDLEPCCNHIIYVNTLNDKLMLREGPGTSYPILYQMPKGSECIWHGERSGKWLKVTYKGVTGYAYGDYFRL